MSPPPVDYTINVDGPLAQWSPSASPTNSKPAAPSSSTQPKDEQLDAAYSNQTVDLYDESLVLDNKPTPVPRWSNFKKAMALLLAIVIVVATVFGV